MIYNIAIDGPAGAGKSTIARRVAKELSFIYVDTGAMYRAMALYLLRKEVNRDDTEQIGNICQDAEISIEYQNGEQIVLLNGENVNSYLRTEEVGNMASVSSAVPRVREKLLSLQRKLAKDMSVVMDGRDIGTTILPDADVKIYLTASSLTRAKRRYLELQEKGTVCNLDDIQKDIEERDQRDMSREISPLRQAEDAVLVDSSNLTIQQVVDRILQIFRSKTTGEDSHES
ncbi:(d)CMP kinase [Ruminococcus sp. AF17-22AC]|uniref:(d)CMP kinase n=1 Tax=Clostridia TaxID=186801 RepID=UPI000E526571|nr:(d)CMP kinase [Ruminococcus sp. AF17-22AC]RGU34849.1 (d)CMP kinase [Ruminococcus sp. AF17-22AC]